MRRPLKKTSLASILFAGALLAVAVAVEAQQQKKIPRIGFLSGRGPANNPQPLAFREGLRQLGWVEGENVSVEYRYTDGNIDRLTDLATEFVNRNFDIIVTGNDNAVAAAKKLTQKIPIVMAGTGDPIGGGLVASLASPGGNVTGVSALSPDLSTTS
jgi:putative ABC transport system substrate-binding protein